MSITSQFQSTLPVWGGTVQPIHNGVNYHEISIHPPRVGRDKQLNKKIMKRGIFQSTLPVWGGTGNGRRGWRRRGYFNPPSPCGEGLGQFSFSIVWTLFQSTLPVWGGTISSIMSGFVTIIFQSTLPVWGGTGTGFDRRNVLFYISIHPPRVGRDV